ncbi:hypothetical protein B0H13DRAFT_1894820 [Mycena leptocephala]|nr:hypothetical protein B0H13DRAFT_1894820 [Mycena leptocephala]
MFNQILSRSNQLAMVTLARGGSGLGAPWMLSSEELQEMVCGTVCHKWWHGRLPEHDMTTLKRLKVEGQALGVWFDTIIPAPSSFHSLTVNLVMPLAQWHWDPPLQGRNY